MVVEVREMEREEWKEWENFDISACGIAEWDLTEVGTDFVWTEECLHLGWQQTLMEEK